MTCTTCGRENPPHLTFCQECGQRLGPRIAPPTPPIGLGVDSGSHASHASPDQVHIPSRLATSLGAAISPVAGLGATHAQPSPAHRAQPPQQGTQENARPCRVCATPNGPGLRYCTSCGTTLEAPAQAAPAAPLGQTALPAAGSAPRLVEPAAPAPFAATALASHNPPSPAIAPMRVVDLGSGARPAGDGPRICTRCRGVVDGGAQFCKFCGAPLAEAALQSAPQAAAPSPSPGIGAGAREPARTNGFVAGQPQPRASAPPLQPQPQIQPHQPQAEVPKRVDPARPPTVPMQQAQQPAPPAGPEHASAALDPPTPFASFPAQQAYIQATVQPAPSAAPSQIPHAQERPAPPPPPPPAPPPAPAPAAPPATPAPAPAAAPAAAPAPAAAAAAAAPAARPAVTRGRLVVIAKSGADGPSYPIGDSLDVGRLEGQIIVGEDPYLSPRHVRIAWTGSKMVLRDLASTNGVYIRLVAARDMNAAGPGKQGRQGASNEEKVPGEVAIPLLDQDLILVGQQVLRFEIVKDGEAGFGPAQEHGTLLFGSPAAPRYARLSQRTVEGVTRDVYYVRKVETVLGRESGDVVFTEDPFLSRRHAAIRVLGRDGSPLPANSVGAARDRGTGGPVESVQFALVDLGSSNGSFMRIRNEIDLVPGDHFRVGQQLFRVDLDTNSGSAGRAG